MKINKKNFGIYAVFLLVVILGVGIVAGADLIVDGFSCPKDVAKDAGSFACTATIKKTIGGSATLNYLKLYPNSPAWLELPNGELFVGRSWAGSIDSEKTEITFENLKAVSAGSNKGFSEIYLDDVRDTSVANKPNSKVNVIDLIVTTSNTASSAASGASFNTLPQVTTSGSGSVTLSITIDSGGCSIGSQASQKTTIVSGDNSVYTPANGWAITQGSSGDCRFTLTAAMTGAGGAATKTSTLSQSVTCTDCTTTTTTTTTGPGGSSGAGGGGGGSTTVITPITKLINSIITELGKDELFGFSFGNVNHTLSVLDVTATTATIKIESEPQIFTLSIEEEKQVDLDADKVMDISIRLKSINVITKKATFVLTPLYIPEERKKAKKGRAGDGDSQEGSEKTDKTLKENNYIIIVLSALIAIILIIISIRLALNARKGKRRAS